MRGMLDQAAESQECRLKRNRRIGPQARHTPKGDTTRQKVELELMEWATVNDIWPSDEAWGRSGHAGVQAGWGLSDGGGVMPIFTTFECDGCGEQAIDLLPSGWSCGGGVWCEKCLGKNLDG